MPGSSQDPFEIPRARWAFGRVVGNVDKGVHDFAIRALDGEELASVQVLVNTLEIVQGVLVIRRQACQDTVHVSARMRTYRCHATVGDDPPVIVQHRTTEGLGVRAAFLELFRVHV